MHVTPTDLPEVVILLPDLHEDSRGFFYESWTRRAFAEAVDSDVSFVQENRSRSAANVLRGLHYQLPNPQGKLVQCIRGAVFDVAVDLRRSSPRFLEWTGVELTEDNHRQLWVPAGFAHGFLAMSEFADIVYKTTAYFDAASDRAVRWDDPAIGIRWPLEATPLLSSKDQNAPMVAQAEVFD